MALELGQNSSNLGATLGTTNHAWWLLSTVQGYSKAENSYDLALDALHLALMHQHIGPPSLTVDTGPGCNCPVRAAASSHPKCTARPQMIPPTPMFAWATLRLHM